MAMAYRNMGKLKTAKIYLEKSVITANRTLNQQSIGQYPARGRGIQ